MSKKRSGILEELDLQDVEGFTEAQKAYYLSMGYKPYRSTSGKIKWLSPELHSRRINNIKRRNALQRMFTIQPKVKPYHRRHRSQFVKFIRANWFFLAIMLVIAIILAVFFLNPQLLIRS